MNELICAEAGRVPARLRLGVVCPNERQGGCSHECRGRVYRSVAAARQRHCRCLRADFTSFEQTGIHLQAQQPRVDVVLQAGEFSESVQVNADAGSAMPTPVNGFAGISVFPSVDGVAEFKQDRTSEGWPATRTARCSPGSKAIVYPVRAQTPSVPAGGSIEKAASGAGVPARRLSITRKRS